MGRELEFSCMFLEVAPEGETDDAKAAGRYTGGKCVPTGGRPGFLCIAETGLGLRGEAPVLTLMEIPGSIREVGATGNG